MLFERPEYGRDAAPLQKWESQGPNESAEF